MSNQLMTRITTVGTAVLALIMILVPFHAMLTVVSSLLVGHYDLLRLWKEVLLMLLTPLAALVVWKTPGLWKQLRGGWLFWTIICYAILTVILGLLALAKGQVNVFAMGYAWTVDLRPMLVLLLAWVFASRSDWLHRHWRKIVLWPAALVISFGLLQAFVLPHDFLQRFGYGPSTIEAFETVDNKLDYIRVQSTLRGANPFGAYLVLVLSAAVILLRRGRDRLNLGLIALVVAGAIVLVVTYSRSAYLGLALSLLASTAFLLRSPSARKRLGWGLAVLAIVGAGAFAALRDNTFIQNTLFHTDDTSQSSTSSNEMRASALQSGVRDVVTEPFGRGPGTAGPASAHNRQPARIAENYYLQIGQETGWLGLGLFVAIVMMVARRLWVRRHHSLAQVLLISLVGISFINLIQHAWTDDTLAVLWWGLAGVALALPLAKDVKTKKGTVAHAKAKD